jgi:hypothetical protein
MLTMAQLKAAFVFGPIITLLAMGLALTLRSGSVSLSTGQGLKRLAENFSYMFVMVLVCLVALLILQQLVGFRLGIRW